MQISHLSEDRSGAGEKYCDIEHTNTVVQRDLVTLYENVDTKQTSNNKNSVRPPNQYVETVVYNEDQESEGSESEFYTNEDFYDVVLINKERIDLINSFPSLDKTLCQKFGNIAIQADHGSDCTDGILFKSPLRKEQFNSLNRMLSFGTFDGAFFSTSLLDFVCCNNLDDNSNLYMDNIIQYARRTIEQLRRISNGDYLTEKAKEKWKTLGNKFEDRKNNEVVKVASVSSNPLRIECNVDAFKTRWRDFIHSELDIRSLTKILEKRIIKIPRLIYGSFTFLDKRCENNLVITCQKESELAARGDGSKSQIDIVVQLKSSNNDNLGSEIESVLVIRNSLQSIKDESWLPLEFNSLKSETNINNNVQNQLTLTEFNEYEEDIKVHTYAKGDDNSTDFAFQCGSSGTKSSELSLCEITSLFTMATNDGTSNYSSEKHCNSDQVNIETQISCFRPTADDLFATLQKLGTQTVVLEETEETSLTKRKSPTKVRVKSPYENKSHILEEKKRRKLLEIRERREKKKKSLSENCKVTKHKHGKAVMAQSSNSVTKLSITNKSFYTSIYGDKTSVTGSHSVKHSHIDPLDKDDDNDDYSVKDVTILKKENSVGYGYYMDDPETEVMNLKFKNKHKNNRKQYKAPNCSNSTTNFDTFAGVASYNSSTSELKPKSEPCDSEKRARSCCSEMLYNTPRENIDSNINNNSNKKSLTSVECKKSIDKIYELMRKLSKVDSSESMYPSHKVTPADTSFNDSAKDKKVKVDNADSCASIKCQLIESNPSIFSFEGKNNEALYSDKGSKKSGLEANSITKVIISSKPHIRAEKNETKPHKRVRIHSPENISKNPLKAISHLINEFDNIQKGRQRPATEPRDRKANSFVENKTLPRFNLPRKVTRAENENKDGKLIPNKNVSSNDTKNQYRNPMVRGKTLTEPIGNMNKGVEREKKVVDIVDEALREARGEAVKGPPRQFTRLDSLAQPKKSYVNAQMEAMKPRYGRNYVPGPPAQVPQAPRPIRQRRNEQDIIYVSSSKTTNNIPPKVTDRYKRVRRMPNNGPIEIVVPQMPAPTYKQRPVPEAPRTSKKMIPFESYPKKRPFTLSESVTSSNLLQKSSVATDFPAYQIIQHSKDAPSSVATTSSFENDSTGENKLQYDPLQNELAMSLSVITESKTTMSCNEKRHNFAGTLTSNDELISICSDFIIDVFEDKNILTAVSNINKNTETNDIYKEKSKNEIQAIYSDTNIPHNGIVRRIDSLEKALYNQISQGTFPKRLKIKKLTLTPKQSTNQVLLLQCGDANSMIEKSRISKKLHFGRNKSITSMINMPLFDSIQDRYFPKFPVNITTVGYVFSKPKSIEIKSIESSATTGSRCMGIQTHFCPNKKKIIDEYFNDEKGVQTLRIEDDLSNAIDKIFKIEKVDKSTGQTKSLLNLNKIRENEKGMAKTENIENTTSLDILVELLDEIEKITKYQNLNASKVQNMELHNPYKLLSKSKSHEHKPDKNISDMINVDLNHNITKKINKSALNCVDKEVAVNITKECVNECTETPQSLLTNFNKIGSISITEIDTNLNKECIDLITNADSQMSTNKNPQNSVTGIVSQPSSNSLISLYDYRSYCLRNFKVTPIHNYDECNKFIEEHEILEKNELKDHGKYEIIHVKNSAQRKNGGVREGHKEFDILKMKRDILVTVYSILVFTVFAALSFPEFIYRS
ncbi:hypothetical protein RR46_05698 [Papilio xuthus]|uniref:Uncharacterized protein n=1 Tax=Papilio xuthus TaxID=66420 RepID=A0A194PUJ8_PAPXU|nr:hypothetical protein RR46_05698 [Papilio xuthus]